MSTRAEAPPPHAHPFELRHLRSRAASDFGQALIAALPSLAAPPGELRAVGLSMRHHGHTEAVLFWDAHSGKLPAGPKPRALFDWRLAQLNFKFSADSLPRKLR